MIRPGRKDLLFDGNPELITFTNLKGLTITTYRWWPYSHKPIGVIALLHGVRAHVRLSWLAKRGGIYDRSPYKVRDVVKRIKRDTHYKNVLSLSEEASPSGKSQSRMARNVGNNSARSFCESSRDKTASSPRNGSLSPSAGLTRLATDFAATPSVVAVCPVENGAASAAFASSGAALHMATPAPTDSPTTLARSDVSDEPLDVGRSPSRSEALGEPSVCLTARLSPNCSSVGPFCEGSISNTSIDIHGAAWGGPKNFDECDETSTDDTLHGIEDDIDDALLLSEEERCKHVFYHHSWIEGWNRLGFAVHGMDIEGHGLSDGWQGRRCSIEEMDDVRDDVIQWLQIINSHTAIAHCLNAKCPDRQDEDGQNASRRCPSNHCAGSLDVASVPGSLSKLAQTEPPPADDRRHYCVNPRAERHRVFLIGVSLTAQVVLRLLEDPRSPKLSGAIIIAGLLGYPNYLKKPIPKFLMDVVACGPLKRVAPGFPIGIYRRKNPDPSQQAVADNDPYIVTDFFSTHMVTAAYKGIATARLALGNMLNTQTTQNLLFVHNRHDPVCVWTGTVETHLLIRQLLSENTERGRFWKLNTILLNAGTEGPSPDPPLLSSSGSPQFPDQSENPPPSTTLQSYQLPSLEALAPALQTSSTLPPDRFGPIPTGSSAHGISPHVSHLDSAEKLPRHPPEVCPSPDSTSLECSGPQGVVTPSLSQVSTGSSRASSPLEVKTAHPLKKATSLLLKAASLPASSRVLSLLRKVSSKPTVTDETPIATRDESLYGAEYDPGRACLVDDIIDILKRKDPDFLADRVELDLEHTLTNDGDGAYVFDQITQWILGCME